MKLNCWKQDQPKKWKQVGNDELSLPCLKVLMWTEYKGSALVTTSNNTRLALNIGFSTLVVLPDRARQ